MNHDDLHTIDRALCGEIWASDTASRNLETLCLEYGGRFAGSEDDRAAAGWVARLWQEYGLANVHTEPFPFTAWQRGSASLTLVAPAGRPYPCLALPYAPSCDLAAEVIDLSFGLEEDFRRAGDAVAGKIALTMNGVPAGQRPAHRLEKYVRARAAGAVAFLFADNEPGMLPPTGSLAFVQEGPLDQALPSAGIPHEVGRELSRRAKRGPVRLRLQMDNRLWRATSWNVVGDLPGGNPADAQTILVAAHLDGHDIAQAAVDNGSGVVAITEVARVLAGQGSALPRTVRFVCFGAEELGMLGSYAYIHSALSCAREHVTELDRIQFIFNADCVGGNPPIGLALQDCPELEPAFTELSRGLEADVSVQNHLVPFSDQFPFTLQGLPSAFIATMGADRRGWGHTAADTLDKVNLPGVRLAATVIGRLVLRVANDIVPWPGRRRTVDEVKSALQAAGIEPLLRAQQVWP